LSIVHNKDVLINFLLRDKVTEIFLVNYG
jgi:hypothetical protein